MNRDEFKNYAVGVFYYQNRANTLDTEKLEAFVDGAVMAYDKVHKMISTPKLINDPSTFKYSAPSVFSEITNCSTN